MSDRYMDDVMHANLHFVKFTGVQLVAGYDTGSPEVRWTDADKAYVRGLGLIFVGIDQGFTGSPVPATPVRDVERGAWSPEAAVNRAGWTAERPTIYAARDDMLTVVELGWTGDIWLAWPETFPPARDAVLAAYPEYKRANLIGVQCGEDIAGLYDKSVIYDPYWPGRAPAPPAPPTWTETLMQQLPTLREGATGTHVRTVQFQCGERGYGTHIDGIYGPATAASVRAVQSAAHILADGVTGPQTWPVLLGVS